MIRTIYRKNGAVCVLNQNLLPHRSEYECLSDYREVVTAIKELKVRGAPLIGVTAAYGIALAMDSCPDDPDQRLLYWEEVIRSFANSRPTAVNLFWAIDRMKQVFELGPDNSADQLRKRLWQEAEQICAEDIQTNLTMGEQGVHVLPDSARVLTICNAGALATCGYGTALGVIRSAHRVKRIEKVWVCETRPVLQGSRLTIWELQQDEIPVSLITDSMAASIMQQGKVDVVVAGADRIAANGDTANKIGTYALAVLAAYHNIPFYIAAPLSTVDMNIKSGQQIPIEERGRDEVRQIGGIYITVPEVEVYNPAFDVTPSKLITGIITEAGVIKPPYIDSLIKVKGK
ncbi:MAG TPA: S-methyl-5-thioribose-1-phosphate isomerase [Syntrophomonadaceae bacterium]|jgi:methylthioribose-1-phosphate isomerase|nr:S-methyl-5-thioribose-1-phosphate isomerase [Syntrophomonadaceae bacterium]